ncbi:hypothetical protein [Qipengyuania sp. MTN3-11]|uniref:hypothetical protein n=1 Tax=Qipengyuania sp. MTN3-11 TaxID=3056557 RepID=UPI0036F4211D
MEMQTALRVQPCAMEDFTLRLFDRRSGVSDVREFVASYPACVETARAMAINSQFEVWSRGKRLFSFNP